MGNLGIYPMRVSRTMLTLAEALRYGGRAVEIIIRAAISPRFWKNPGHPLHQFKACMLIAVDPIAMPRGVSKDNHGLLLQIQSGFSSFLIIRSLFIFMISTQ
jgi:hypothetical protein